MTSRRCLLPVLVLFVCLGAKAQAYVLHANSWGAGATVTYSFNINSTYFYDETAAGGGSGNTTLMQNFMPVGWENEIRKAFGAWEAVADIHFAEVADNDANFNAAGAVGDIRIAGHAFDGSYGTLAHGFYPPPNGLTAAGDLHFDVAETWWINDGGSPVGAEIDLFSVALHEIGHNIGLKHSADPSAVMFDTYWFNSAQALSADDIAGAEAAYGSSASPEPETWLVLILGGVLYAVFLRQRRVVGQERFGQ